MFSLEEVLVKCNQEELVKGKMVYTDKVPYSSEDITDNNEKSYLLKALEGLVSPEDIENNSTDISKLLKKYILNNEDVENLEIDDGDVDSLIELRLIADAKSKYLERLDKLMFRIYFESDRSDRWCELEGLIYEKCGKYDWTEQFIKNDESDKKIIFQENTPQYNEKFGVGQKEENDSRMSNDTSQQETIEQNWILQKFGG